MMPMDLKTKEEVAYKAATDLEQSCSECMSFKAPKTCTTVEGPVDPSFTCDQFTSEDAAETAEPDPEDAV